MNDRDILTHYSQRVGKLMKESDEFNQMFDRNNAIYGISPEEFDRNHNTKDMLMQKLISIYVNQKQSLTSNFDKRRGSIMHRMTLSW